MHPPPRGRILEGAGPQATPGSPRLPLRRRIAAAAVPGVVERVAGAHHGLAEIGSVDRANGDVALVAIMLDHRAGDRASRDGHGERAGRLASAGIGTAAAV